MTVFRLWCLCLVMLALPLQGLAAASMQYCGTRAPGATAATGHSHGAMDQHASAGDEHAAHHGHSAHHVDPAEAGDAAVLADEDVNAGHKCAMCAFCGHAVAVNDGAKPLEFGEPAHASPPEPSVLIPVLAVLVPDKPPRA